MAEFEAEDDYSDLVPIPQDDGPNPVVPITYPPLYVQFMNIFRAIMFKGELSLRALNLTTELLDINASNYTIWQYRRECLRKLCTDINEELDFMDSFAEENPKNYQIWYHRRAVVESVATGDENSLQEVAKRELLFCDSVIKIDSKNYHSWAHRQWTISKFNAWDGEVQYIERLLAEDIRNNSAWNQRWFCIHQDPKYKDSNNRVKAEVLSHEINYCFDSLQIVKQNESVWNYLRGLQRHYPQFRVEIMNRCQELVDTTKDNNIYALGLLADMRESVGGILNVTEAEKLFLKLIQIDKIRVKSWTRRLKSLLEKKLSL